MSSAAERLYVPLYGDLILRFIEAPSEFRKIGRNLVKFTGYGDRMNESLYEMLWEVARIGFLDE